MGQQFEPRRPEGYGDDPGTASASLQQETLRCGARATRTLQSSLLAPSEARTYVAERICPLHDALAVAAAALVASEVVTHAVLRGKGPIAIALQCEVTTLTIWVTCSMDGLSETPELRLSDPIAGMIVDKICRSSGTLPAEHGVTMWCTIPTGYVPVQTWPAWTTSLSDPPVSGRPKTMRTLNAQGPPYGT